MTDITTDVAKRLCGQKIYLSSYFCTIEGRTCTFVRREPRTKERPCGLGLTGCVRVLFWYHFCSFADTE